MTKVHGTGVYDFKRCHVAEYLRDQLTRIAAANWLRSGGSKPEKPFDPQLVKDIYETELTVKSEGKSQRKIVPLQRVMILEGRELTIAEKTNYLVFMINAFQSLEDEIVMETVLRLASLRSWHSLSYGHFQMELCLNPDLIKKWKRMIKKESDDAKKLGVHLDPLSSLEVNFLRNLIEEFLEVFTQKNPVSEDDELNASSIFDQVDDASILYCERFMEFLFDLLSQLPTRMYHCPATGSYPLSF
ncbi:hypothetical protein GOBAR_DD21843 [Gossypium barbadense]|nr:hypothetical protein GOBAR_DD21843 [Gossypium barbadense]